MLAFLGNDKVDFVHRLDGARNPVTAYRFGTRLDEGYYQFVNKAKRSPAPTGKLFPRTSARTPKVKALLDEADPLPPEFWRAWLVPHLEYKPKVEWDEDRTRLFKELDAYNLQTVGDPAAKKRLGEGGLAAGTNLYQSVTDALNRELKNQVQGIVIFSDGRSNLGSSEILEELKRKAAANQIPILVVGVGSTRPGSALRSRGPPLAQADPAGRQLPRRRRGQGRRPGRRAVRAED